MIAIISIAVLVGTGYALVASGVFCSSSQGSSDCTPSINSETSTTEDCTSQKCATTSDSSSLATNSTTYFSTTSSSNSPSFTTSTETFSSTFTSASTRNSTALYPLPKSHPIASHLYVASDTTWGYTLTALQGLVARQSPQIFFVANSMDRSYLNLIEHQYNVTSENSTAEEILQKFVTSQYVSQTNSKFNIVVFDSNEPASDFYWETNTARTIAGVTAALPGGFGAIRAV